MGKKKEERLTIGSVQEDVSRPRSQTRQRLVTLTVQPVEETGLDVFIVVLSLRSQTNIARFERSEEEKVTGGRQTLSPGASGPAGERRRPL